MPRATSIPNMWAEGHLV